ncbi:hypothetical protein [Rhizobium sp. TRM95796]|uniref:hypothetical protein n=1 Tax=Rhizobium sp. TRM95796 TaxID=2979862 RepID=UPI0021E7AA57|nr:hypothetical protein [Rhizobium sp. TRM95796]MCV3764404.1 hypothetical protein [Rhizobium sp. TRM95796]
MKARIILHCGAPKTGSTSFQHLLYANRPLLLEKGFYCPAVSRKKRVKDDVRILLGEMSKPENDNQAYRFHIGEVIEKIRAETGCHTLIISNENLLGKPFMGPRRKFYESAEERAERLHLALQDYDVDVRFVIRDYAGFLPSWYVQQVRMGSAMRFSDFLHGYDFKGMNWAAPVSALRRHFEPGRVGIFDHADMIADPIGFLRAMFPDVMAALGDRGRELPNKNISIGAGMVERYRRWSEIATRISPSPRWRARIHQIGRRYGLLPLERFSRSPKLVMPDDMAKALRARYQADRDALRPQRVPPVSPGASA